MTKVVRYHSKMHNGVKQQYDKRCHDLFYTIKVENKEAFNFIC